MKFVTKFSSMFCGNVLYSSWMNYNNYFAFVKMGYNHKMSY